MRMFTTLASQVSGKPLPLGEAVATALMGYGVVFLGILLLVCVVVIVSRIMAAGKKKAAEPTTPAPDRDAPLQKLISTAPKAPGSAGELKLYDTDPKTAAMLMAIVADKMGKPINELRFKSIREVK